MVTSLQFIGKQISSLSISSFFFKKKKLKVFYTHLTQEVISEINKSSQPLTSL
jgi:hypothetical protein